MSRLRPEPATCCVLFVRGKLFFRLLEDRVALFVLAFPEAALRTVHHVDGAVLREHPRIEVEDTLRVFSLCGDAVDVPTNRAAFFAVDIVNAVSCRIDRRILKLPTEEIVGVAVLLLKEGTEVGGIVLREVIVQNRCTAVGELLCVLIGAVGISGFREEAFFIPLVSNLQSFNIVVVIDSKLNVVIRLRPVCINKVRVAVGTM